jgi:hypothetical protein
MRQTAGSRLRRSVLLRASGTGRPVRAFLQIVPILERHCLGWKAMRKNEPLVNKLLTHFLMGVALGLSLVLLLGLIEAFHVRELIAHSEAPMQTTVMLVTTYGLMFGIGAALTGLVLTLEEEDR